MNVVAIRMDNNKIFSSQSFMNEKQKNTIIENINNEANNAGADIEIVFMTNDELEEFMS